MFPYNKAANRNIRRSKRNNEIEENISAGPIMEGTEDSDVLWDFTEYKLTYVLDNFQMPQIVRVVEGFMFTEDDSLASGTILTIHGQQKIERICAVDRNGEGEDIFIPLSCPYKVKVTVPDRERIYRSVKDLCNATPLPKCVIVHEKISAGGVKIPSGRMLIVKSISKNREGQAEGVLVELLDSSIRNLVLPLKIIGNFAPCPLPSDQNKTYFVRELSERLFPLWVTFRPSFEKSPPYGPHMGAVKLQKLETTDVVFSTSIIDGKRFAISFSRDLPVTVEMARNATHDASTLSNKLRQTEEQIDIGVLSYLADTNPYSDKYQSAIYADVCALRKAFEQRGIIERARNSSDSFQSDASCSEERLSSNSHRYILDRAFPKGRSRNSSLGGDSQSIDSQSNHSADSSNELQPPLYTYVKHPPNSKAIEKVNQSDSDLEDEEGYTLIAEQMDYPFTSRKQNRTKGSGLVQPYECTEIRTSSPTQRKPDWNFFPPPHRAESPPIVPVRKKKQKSGSASSVQSGEPYSSKVSLNRSSSDNLAWQENTMPPLNCHIPETLPPSPETLTLSHGTLPSGHGTLPTGHGTLPSGHGTLPSGHGTLPSGQRALPLSDDSELSDAESVASDYHSVKSEPGSIARSSDSIEPTESKQKHRPPPKPQRPKGPPRPIPRKSSLKSSQNKYANFSLAKADSKKDHNTNPGFISSGDGETWSVTLNSKANQRKEQDSLSRRKEDIEVPADVTGEFPRVGQLAGPKTLEADDPLLDKIVAKPVISSKSDTLPAKIYPNAGYVIPVIENIIIDGNDNAFIESNSSKNAEIGPLLLDMGDHSSGKARKGDSGGPRRKESSSYRKATKSYENVELDITKESKEDDSVDLHRKEFSSDRKAAKSPNNIELPSPKESQNDRGTDNGNEHIENEGHREEKYRRKFSVADAGEDEVCKLLDEIQLSDFKEIFKEEQINGSLLEGLDIETLTDLGLNRFQAVKLIEYVKGWRQDEECTSESNDPDEWTTDNVQQRMQRINLKKLAEFCAENQVDGKLLQSLIDNNVLECLTKTYSVGLNKFNTNKLIRYVKKGWRPDTSS